MRSLLLKAPRAAALAVLAAAVPLAAAVTFAPAKPRVARAVTFAVSDSYPIAAERGLSWSFGDGSGSMTYAPTAVHAYTAAGTFAVRVDYWARPATGGFIQRTGQALVTVFADEVLGPRGDFRVSFLRMRFDDGKTYKIVARGTRELKAFVDIKTEGSGILHYEWLVDGVPFRQGTRTLSFARPAVLDSGKVPGLP
ncbi:MAG: PKD domain-containing protein, partial [Candidatus Aminicenantes bacterium]|nr:PKD domain-containing protein [Candidatus Aminicenantes bacterium]